MISITRNTDFLVDQSHRILDAISIINSSPHLIAIVVSSDNKLLGTITDGDIRRGLLSGINLNDPCYRIMNKKPLASLDADTNEQRLNVMIANNIKQLPLINKNKEVIGLLYLGDPISEMPCKSKMLIMAGGFGKRMHPLTDDLPKPMLMLGDKPILEHIILKAKHYGFREFIISLHYLPEKIREYFKDGQELDIKIEYIIEKEPLGTAGAISLIEEDLAEPLVVTNGDLLIDINYRNFLEYHTQNSSDASMAIRKHTIENPFGVVKTKDIFIQSVQEKPKYTSSVNAGIYVITQRVKNKIQSNKYTDMPDLLDDMLKSHKDFKLLAYPLHENWLDIGKPTDLITANKLHESKRL